MNKLIFVTLVSLLSTACSEQVSESKEPLIRPAKFYYVSDQSAEKIRNFPAVVEASEDATLAFRVSGVISELLVKPGQEIAKGELLAKLDPTDYLIRVEQAQANYELASSQYNRSKQLLTQKLISPSMYDESQAQLQVAQATLKTAKKNLQYTELHAPFDGEVAKTYVEAFENVVAKQVILNLQDRDKVDIAIQVPESFIANVKKGSGYQPTVRFDPKPELEYKSTLKEWDTKADSVTNTYRVVFSLNRPSEFNALPGMTANLSVELSKVIKTDVNQLSVPIESIFAQSQDGVINQFVWKVKDGTVVKSPVKVGALKEDSIEVVQGISVGDIVIAAGVHRLYEGTKVREWKKERGL